MCTCLALAVTLDGSLATQYSTALGGPEQAVDGNPSTSSCTQDTAGQPWWSIDLGDVYRIASVTVTFPATGGDTRKSYYLYNIKNSKMASQPAMSVGEYIA